jgi:membrane-bound lytic murein transglycosylase D
MKSLPRAASLGLAAVLGAGVLVGCATEPGREPTARDWPMVPSTRNAHGTPPTTAAEPAAPVESVVAAEADTVDPADALVSLPVPPDYTPMADLANVFDRIRLGYGLPDVADRSVDQQARYFAGKPEFLDRTFERAERYLYYVVRELETRNMPLELAMLPVIESAYNPYAYSRARAAGIWQFIAPTATRYQVRVNWWQDGRRDIVDSTRAALDYLSELHTRFDGDWLKAIAAYNCGELAVERAVDRNRRARKPTDFFHLKLPRETRAYVPELLAMARIVANPEAYGLEFTTIANKPYFAQVEVGSQLNLRVAAALLGVTEDELHALNPAFNRWATDPDGPYHLLVPYAAAPEFARTVTSLSRDVRMPVEHYRIEDGDTLAKLARDRDITIPTIRQLNTLTGGDFRVGDDLVLPTSTVAPLRAGLIIEGETPLPGRHRRSYVIRRGDTLASIARRNGVAIGDLERLNGLVPHAHLEAGDRLLVETGTRHKRHRHKASRPPSADDAAQPRKVGDVPRRSDMLHAVARRFQPGIGSLRDPNSPAVADLGAGPARVLHADAARPDGG